MDSPLDLLHPEDLPYLRRALDLAAQGVGRTSPNPMVGCVLVKHDEVIGEGFHVYAARDHAEIVALKQAGRAAAGATAYITLEPCGTHGRTPPCAEALIAARIKKAVLCTLDPNPANHGVGYDLLLRAGVILRWGLLKQEAEALNRAFLKVQATGLPWVTIKVAASLDGHIASAAGDSRGLSGSGAHWLVHQLRATVDAIVIGAGTLVADNPRLTTRWDEYADHAVEIPSGFIPHRAPAPRTPLRVVVSGQLAFEPAKYRLFQSAREHPVLVITRKGVPAPALKTLDALGVQVAFVKASRNGLDPEAILHALVKAGCNHVLIEGGGRLLTPIIEAGLWDELFHVQAPVLLGGEEAPVWLGGKGVKRLGQAQRLQRTDLMALGADVVQRFVQG